MSVRNLLALLRGAGPELLCASGLPIVRDVRTKGRANRKLVVESAAFGLGYTAVLIWSGSALVASFTGAVDAGAADGDMDGAVGARLAHALP